MNKCLVFGSSSTNSNTNYNITLRSTYAQLQKKLYYLLKIPSLLVYYFETTSSLRSLYHDTILTNV